jgi:transcriptional regulator with XRE-family HTH domain
MNYSKAIRIVRASRNISQKDLGILLKTDASYISMVESGKRKVTKSFLKSFSKTFSIPLNLIELLAAEKEELKNISEENADKVGRELLNVLLSTQSKKIRA